MSTVGNLIIVEEGRHSKRGASSATRWLACPGSINLTDKLLSGKKIELSTSRAAAEGTAAHLVLSSCLEDGSDAHEMSDISIEVSGWTFVVDDEMIAGVQETLDWVRARVAKAEADGFEVHLHIEKGLSSFLHEDAFGTSDILIHIVGDRLIVVDFKYGRGVSVEPTSDQNGYYGYLAVENYVQGDEDISVVESWIAQPRIPHPNGTIRRHITSVQELTDWWMNVVIPGIEETQDPDAHLVIGEHCRFCPNKGHCPALKSEVFEFPMGIDATHLSDEELGEILNKLSAIKAVQDTFESEALRRARQGSKIPGRKLVRMKANRTFKDTMPQPDPEDADETVEVSVEDAINETFGLDGYAEPKLKSPAQIAKLDGGTQFVAQWAYSPDKGLTLAATSDKRAEVKPNIERLGRPIKAA